MGDVEEGFWETFLTGFFKSSWHYTELWSMCWAGEFIVLGGLF